MPKQTFTCSMSTNQHSYKDLAAGYVKLSVFICLLETITENGHNSGFWLSKWSKEFYKQFNRQNG